MKNILKDKKIFNDQGYAGIIALLTVCSLVLILTFSLSASLFAKKQISKNLYNSIRSYYMAESGVEDAVYRKINDLNLPASPVVLGGASIDQVFSPPNLNGEIVIDSVSVYDNNYRKLKTVLKITTSDIAFHYGVQVGEGGLTMGNTSSVDGNIYSNGTITGDNNAVITGDVFVATGITLDQDWTVYNSDKDFGKVSPVLDIAQSFSPILPPVSVMGGGGTGALVTANVSGGAITSVNVMSGGSGFTSSPVVSIGGGSGVVFTGPSIIGGVLQNDIVVTFGGSGYSSTDGDLSLISFYLKKTGNPANRTIYLVDDNSGSPAKTFAGGAPPSIDLDTAMIGTSYGWIDFSFSNPVALVSGLTYWIIIDTAQNNIKYFTIGKDSSSGNTDSVSKYSADWIAGSPVWIEDAGDFNFKVWMGGVPTSLVGIEVGGNAYAHNIVDCDIMGDAFYQTISGSTVGGAVCPNVKCHPGSPDPVIETLPISDSNIAEWKNDAIAINPNLDTAFCTKPISFTINGGVLDCTLAPGGAFAPAAGITITLGGTLWVKGNITLGIGTKVILDSGYGINSGVILADNPGFESTSGKILTNNNVIICGSQGINGTNCYPSVGSYILMLSTHSGAATYAIDVRNNTNGAIFYAHRGTAHINNGANLKEVTAYKLEIAPTASVTYESGLANATFSTGPGGGWEIISWNETE